MRKLKTVFIKREVLISNIRANGSKLTKQGHRVQVNSSFAYLTDAQMLEMLKIIKHNLLAIGQIEVSFDSYGAAYAHWYTQSMIQYK